MEGLEILQVHYKMTKGLGPGMVEKVYEAGFDDIDAETKQWDLVQWAKEECEEHLHQSPDHFSPVGSKLWTITHVEHNGRIVWER